MISKITVTEAEGIAISKSNGYRTKRPNKRPRKTFGHGIKETWREKLRAKKPEAYVAPVAVEAVPMQSFLVQMLAKRPEARSQMTAADYEAIRNQSKK